MAEEKEKAIGKDLERTIPYGIKRDELSEKESEKVVGGWGGTGGDEPTEIDKQ